MRYERLRKPAEPSAQAAHVFFLNGLVLEIIRAD